MKYSIVAIATISFIVFSTPVFAQTLGHDGYYISGKLIYSQQQAKNMDTSSRPSIGQFVDGDNKVKFYDGSIALGYRLNGVWRVDGEYVFPKKTVFTSGSSNFPTSFNNHEVNSQRFMINVYRDIYFTNNLSVNANLGLGVSRIKSGGSQGNDTRRFGDNTVNNITYSIGAGVSYDFTRNWTVDLGYRFVDMGKVESGYNLFRNVRNLQDEQLRARIVANEFFIGARYNF